MRSPSGRGARRELGSTDRTRRDGAMSNESFLDKVKDFVTGYPERPGLPEDQSTEPAPAPGNPPTVPGEPTPTPGTPPEPPTVPSPTEPTTTPPPPSPDPVPTSPPETVPEAAPDTNAHPGAVR